MMNPKQWKLIGASGVMLLGAIIIGGVVGGVEGALFEIGIVLCFGSLFFMMGL